MIIINGVCQMFLFSSSSGYMISLNSSLYLSGDNAGQFVWAALKDSPVFPLPSASVSGNFQEGSLPINLNATGTRVSNAHSTANHPQYTCTLDTMLLSLKSLRVGNFYYSIIQFILTNKMEQLGESV